jgi:membrane protein DedA with SNARE-associated domain
MSEKFRLNLARVLSLIAVVVITLYVYSIRDQAEELAIYGYPGIFLIALLTNATVLLPAPGIAIVFAMGGIFNPFGVALAAGAGGALGELSGYLAGFSGQAVVERVDIYERLTLWMRRNGPLTVLILAALPNPLFDLAGMAAGALKMPIPRFLLFCWLGVTIKMFFFAFAGASSINWLFE